MRLRTITLKDGYTFDGLANALTGAGTTVDKRMAHFYAQRITDYAQVQASYRDSWLMRKIVDLPPLDMTREWRDWQIETDVITKIEAEEKRLNLKALIRAGLVLGRLGGGAIIIGLNDQKPDNPLPANIGKNSLAYFHLVSRHNLSLDEDETDLTSPYFGQPKAFRLTGIKGNATIHPSRVIAFKGLPVPPDNHATREDRFWGDPVYRSVIDAVQNADSALNGFASLIDEAKVDVFGIPGLMEKVGSPDGESKIMRRVEIANVSKSMHRALVMDADEEWNQKQISWAGMPEVARLYLSTVAGAADIPATRLLGKSPDGMNATGQGDEQNYRDMIATMQEGSLRPAMDRIDAVMLPSAGITLARDAWWQFAPLSRLSEQEQSDVDKKRAETAKIYADAGLVPHDALSKGVCNRLIEDGTYPGLEQELATVPEVEAASESDLEQHAKGGDRVSQAAKAGEEAPALRRAANDAAPRTLYVQRKVKNAKAILDWAKKQGFKETLNADDLHVTITYSRTPVDWMKMGQAWEDELKIPAGGARLVEPLGDKGAVVLLFNGSQLSWRHEEMVRAGASHDYPEYQPHITITYQGANIDLSQVEPYQGEIVLGPEIFEELDEEWSQGKP